LQLEQATFRFVMLTRGAFMLAGSRIDALAGAAGPDRPDGNPG
jgi:hypothetical protein